MLLQHRRQGREPASHTATHPEARAGATQERLVKELTLLRRVSTALAREREVGSIIQTAVATCRELFGFDHVIIGTIEGDDLVRRGHEGLHETFPRLPISTGIAGRAVRTGIPQLVRNAPSDPDYVPVGPGTTMESTIAVPIVAAEKVFGVLVIESDETRPLGDDDLHLAEVLAEQVGVALERAQIDEERRSTNREVESERELRAQAEAARAEAEEARAQLARTLESITDGFIALDNDWRFTFLNTNAALIARNEPQSLLGKVIWDEFPALLGTEFEACYRRAFRERRPASVIAFYEPFQIWIDARIYPSETGMALYLRDITEQQIAAEALQRSEDRYRALVEQLPAVTYVQPATGSGVLYTSPQIEELTGYPAERFVEHQDLWFDICHPDDVERVRRAEIHSDTHGTPFLENYRIVHADGRVIWVSDRTVPLRDPSSGEIHSWQGLTLDITAQVTAEEARIRSAEAESANQAKSAFLSRMSHELRTPLNAILGFAQVMRADPLDDNQREGVDQILKAGRHLLSLINEVLELSRIEAGRIALSIEPVPLGEVIEEALALVAPLVDEAGLTVQDGVCAASACVLVDRQRLKQIVLNLLSNAIKYSPAGGTIGVRCDAVRPQSVRLSIEDTGPGIPPELMDRLFEPFDRLDFDHHGTEGSGLGLAVSQRLAGAMGLTIRVDSTPGIGSRFWLDLPLVRSSLAGEHGAAGEEAI